MKGNCIPVNYERVLVADMKRDDWKNLATANGDFAKSLRRFQGLRTAIVVEDFLDKRCFQRHSTLFVRILRFFNFLVWVIFFKKRNYRVVLAKTLPSLKEMAFP